MQTQKINPFLHHGDCLDVLRAMPADSVDSIVTDPPYGLSFIDIEREAEYVEIARARIDAARHNLA